ncbi:cytochrome b [Pararhizobium haloflavum]|uniref:cytochrome b n=1 Tax=Pararhizobium haloflavum TaxID=2037914 RepID=UPI000C183E2D|nr:cytochrome b [Pararhizobium haloflavum]
MQRTTYNPLARFLHWSIFLLVAIGLPIGLIMVERDFNPVTNVLYTVHWSIGLTVLLLMVVRIVVRIVAPPPKPARVLTGAQRMVSSIVHIGLYVMLIVAPVLGWLGKSAYGASPEGISVFYLFHVPVLLEKNEDLAETLLFYHGVAVRIFLAFLALHLAGAFYHGVIARDGVVGRMGIGRRVAEPEA